MYRRTSKWLEAGELLKLPSQHDDLLAAWTGRGGLRALVEVCHHQLLCPRQLLWGVMGTAGWIDRGLHQRKHSFDSRLTFRRYWHGHFRSVGAGLTIETGSCRRWECRRWPAVTMSVALVLSRRQEDERLKRRGAGRQSTYRGGDGHWVRRSNRTSGLTWLSAQMGRQMGKTVWKVWCDDDDSGHATQQGPEAPR